MSGKKIVLAQCVTSVFQLGQRPHQLVCLVALSVFLAPLREKVVCYNPFMRKKPNSNQDRHVILRSPEVFSESEVREKATEIARKEEKIFQQSLRLDDKAERQSDSFYFRRREDSVYLHLAMIKLFDAKPYVDIFLDYYSEPQKVFDYNLDFSIHAMLKLNIFSDLPTLKQFEENAEQLGDDTHFIDTLYYFDETGNAAKFVQLPQQIQDDRKEVYQNKYVRVIQSELTAEDFMYVEKALAEIEKQISLYSKWEKRFIG